MKPHSLAMILALILALMFGGAAAQAGQCSPNSVELRGDWGQARFNVEIADDAAEQAKGLMFREKLAASSGMIFIYEKPHRAVFWMQNVPIALDMLFVDQSGVVTHIAHNARPFDESRIEGGENVLVILEINGGMAKALGITVGSVLHHPAFDSTKAAWPCLRE